MSPKDKFQFSMKVIKPELSKIIDAMGRFPTENELESMGKKHLVPHLREVNG